MTRAELEQWAVLHNWGPAKRDELSAFVEDGFVTVDFLPGMTIITEA
jgi:hypothetical protein